MTKAFKDTLAVEGFYVESSTGHDSRRIMATEHLNDLFNNPRTILIESDGIPMALTGFPLRDFRTSKNRELLPSGMVLIWSAATDQVAAFHSAVWVNIFFAMMGFCVIEILLFLSVNLITRHLTRIIDRRTGQLTQAQDKLVAQARSLGMAEVATDVLHNVGNVLNSVTVGTAGLRDQIAGSRINGVRKVADLLKEKSSGSGQLISEDELGKKLPTYLATLSRQLETEQTENLAKIELLKNHVDHIATIVNQQQDRCTSTNLPTMVDLRQILEETLEITQMNGPDCQIQKRWELPELPMMEIDRHRLLQILVNLTRNAGQAMGDPRAITRIITYQAEVSPEGTLLISVRDTGGGKLVADSEGIGKGAVLTLEIPFRPEGKLNV